MQAEKVVNARPQLRGLRLITLHRCTRCLLDAGASVSLLKRTLPPPQFVERASALPSRGLDEKVSQAQHDIHADQHDAFEPSGFTIAGDGVHDERGAGNGKQVDRALEHQRHRGAEQPR